MVDILNLLTFKNIFYIILKFIIAKFLACTVLGIILFLSVIILLFLMFIICIVFNTIYSICSSLLNKYKEYKQYKENKEFIKKRLRK